MWSYAGKVSFTKHNPIKTYIKINDEILVMKFLSEIPIFRYQTNKSISTLFNERQSRLNKDT